jgi:DnaJ-class molecular chaperone
MDYYEILQISRSASEDMIRSAYKTMAKKYHPDNYNDDGHMMEKVNEAYRILIDPQLRNEYDAKLSDGYKKEEESAEASDNDTSEEPKKSPGIVFTFFAVIIYLIGYTLYFAWGLLVILVIIGFFTGHSQILFGKIFDWILNLIG